MSPAQHSLVDTHAHLDFPEFEGRLEQVVAAADENGVSNIISVATTYEAAGATLEIARRFPAVSPAAAVHPNYVREKFGEFESLAALFEGEPFIAVGETGLDFYRDYTPPDEQKAAFRAHIELALARDLPIIVHVRDAYDEALQVLDGFESAPKGVFHCFSGDADFADEVLERGFFISIAGQVTFANAAPLREVVAGLPLGRLLVETDCPFLAPVPRRGRTNEPAWVRYTAEAVADCLGAPFEDVARATTVNARRLFGVGKEPPRGAIAYPMRGNLYLNITNRCPNSCPWCVRFLSPFLNGHNLALEREPSFDEIIEAVGDVSPYREIVFCGYGEPTMRLDIVEKVGAHLRKSGARVRLDTNGQGSLTAGRDIVPGLSRAVDAVSVSLNTASPEQYAELCRPSAGAPAHAAVIDFIKAARAAISDVTVTAVAVPGVDIEAVRALAAQLGVAFRLRPLQRNL
ncbi:MAG: YchF/TatD family DNA exonuclease [Planctomycetota bacterium]|jgi:TatD DNase family protein